MRSSATATDGPDPVLRPALHHMTALEVSPVELAVIAGKIGAPKVCFLLNARRSEIEAAVVTRPGLRALKHVLDQEGVGVAGADYFVISPRIDPETFRPAFELAAELGAVRVLAIIDDEDRGRALDRFRRTCAIAMENGLGVGLEFMAFTPGCASLSKAVAYVQDAGVPNAGVAVDVLHLVRTGGSPGELARVDPRWISHAQICDGPATRPSEEHLFEAVNERLMPGMGDFPLPEFVAALPPGIDMDIEAPADGLRRQGMPALERARLAMDGAVAALRAGDVLRGSV